MLEQNFDGFWAMYPRHIGKPAAKKALRKALTKDAAAVIASGLQAWLDAWAAAGTGPDFIPYPATWLNQERWNDKPDIAPKVQAVTVDIDSLMADSVEFFRQRDLLAWRHERIAGIAATIRTLSNWQYGPGEIMIRLAVAARRPDDMLDPRKVADLPRIARFTGMPVDRELSDAMEVAYRTLRWSA